MLTLFSFLKIRIDNILEYFLLGLFMIKFSIPYVIEDLIFGWIVKAFGWS